MARIGAPLTFLGSLVLIVSLFSLASRSGIAAPVTNGNSNKATREGLVHVEAGNWTLVKEGAWLIEFYSPFSSFCKTFLPTWEELVESKQHLRTDYPDAPFYLAQVDCMSQRDLCAEEGVPHMPRLTVYRDGKQQAGEYQGDREYNDLSAFVDREASLYRSLKGVKDAPHPLNPLPPWPVPPPAPVQGPGVLPAIDAEKQAKQDAAQKAAAAQDEAAAEVEKQKKMDRKPKKPKVPVNIEGRLISFGQTPIANQQALASWLAKDSNRGPSFVKFYAPWCPHCRAMAPAFKQLGETLRNQVNVIEVDCEAYGDVCNAYGVRGYPTLRMYNDGEVTEYEGARKHDAMHDWAAKAGEAEGLVELNPEAWERKIKEEEVVFLYLVAEGTPAWEADAVERASRSLLTTRVHLYRTSHVDLLTRYASRLSQGSTSSGRLLPNSQSGLLVFKDHNATTPIAAYYPSTLSVELSPTKAGEKVASWLQRYRYPTVTEVTGETFKDVISNKQRARVVLAALSGVHHDAQIFGTGAGAVIRDAELAALTEVALAARASKHPVTGVARSAQADAEGGEEAEAPEVLFGWIDADRWASALKTYYRLKPSLLPTLLLVDAHTLTYWPLPSLPVGPSASALASASIMSVPPGSRKPGFQPGQLDVAQPAVPQWLDAGVVLREIALIGEGRRRGLSSRTYIRQGLNSAGGAIEKFIGITGNHPILSFAFLAVLVAALVLYIQRAHPAAAGSSAHARLSAKAD